MKKNSQNLANVKNSFQTNIKTDGKISQKHCKTRAGSTGEARAEVEVEAKARANGGDHLPGGLLEEEYMRSAEIKNLWTRLEQEAALRTEVEKRVEIEAKERANGVEHLSKCLEEEFMDHEGDGVTEIGDAAGEALARFFAPRL